jgi:hypothetical protein
MQRVFDNPKFKAWFGNSKIVDEQGRPMILYHGTKKDFPAFDPEKTGSATDFGWFGRGIYLTPDPSEASRYAVTITGQNPTIDGSNVMPLVVKVKNPFITDQQSCSQKYVDEIIADGHDAIIRMDYLPDRYKHWPREIQEVVIFNPNQIKSIFAKEFSDSPNLSEGVYPLADRETEWYGNADYKNNNGKLVWMDPAKYLAKVRPLKIDDVSRENIDDLKNHILSGRRLDPLVIYKNGKEDGRHRANAAIELGIKKVPVILFENRIAEGIEIAHGRFNNEDDDDYVYHVTLEPTAQKILQQGFKPSKAFMTNYAGYSKGKVFFTERSGGSFWEMRVEQHAENNMDDPPAVVVLRVPKEEIGSLLRPDPVGTKDSRSSCYFITQPFNPTN